MTMTEPRTFLGVPIEGDIVRSQSRTEQRPLEEFAPLVQALLDEPSVVEFGWRQYTPYFNDGDPCVFSAYGVWVRTTDDGDHLSADELDVGYGHPSLGRRPTEGYDQGEKRYIYGPYEGPDEARYDRCMALYRAVDSGAFDDVLLEAFGDHAEVTVSRGGIRVDTYEHD